MFRPSLQCVVLIAFSALSFRSISAHNTNLIGRDVSARILD